MESIYYFIDSVKAIAQSGLNFAKDNYDKSRYEKIIELCLKRYSQETSLTVSELKKIFEKDIGYVTTKVGCNGVILNSRGEILLEKRIDDNSWGLPGGWIDPSDIPEECCIREIKEETGLNVTLKKLLGVCSRKAGSFNVPHSSVHIIYLCEVVSGELVKSHESKDVKYLSKNEVDVWHKDHLHWLESLGF